MNELSTRIATQAEKILKHIYSLFESVYGYVLFCLTMITGLISREKNRIYNSYTRDIL